MANKNYRNGRRREYETIAYFEDLGYKAVRAAGSHGLWDVIAWNDEYYVHAQVKSNCKPSKKEVELMKADTVPLGTRKVVFLYRNRKPLEIVRIEGEGSKS